VVYIHIKYCHRSALDIRVGLYQRALSRQENKKS
jgi:hypothetical protein